MKKIRNCAGLACALSAMVLASPAYAAPGMGSEVYGATVEKGEVEVEARYGALAGGPDDGEDVLKLELAYAPTEKLRLATVVELEKEPGEHRKAEALSFEAIYELGRAGGIDFALYGEYETVFHGPDKMEAKLLMQRKTGPWDLRLNLIAEKELEGGEPLEFEYAASADVEIFDEVRFGAQAYGELGSSRHFLPHAEHFLGPVAKFEVEGLGPELEIEAGYLFAIDKAKDDTDGQFRLKLGIEF